MISSFFFLEIKSQKSSTPSRAQPGFRLAFLFLALCNRLEGTSDLLSFAGKLRDRPIDRSIDPSIEVCGQFHRPFDQDRSTIVRSVSPSVRPSVRQSVSQSPAAGLSVVVVAAGGEREGNRPTRPRSARSSIAAATAAKATALSATAAPSCLSMSQSRYDNGAPQPDGFIGALVHGLGASRSVGRSVGRPLESFDRVISDSMVHKQRSFTNNNGVVNNPERTR